MLKGSNNLVSDKLVIVMENVKSVLNLFSTWNSQFHVTLEALHDDRYKSVINIGKYTKIFILYIAIKIFY